MASPILIKDPELLQNKTKDDEIIELKHTAEKHEIDIILKSLKTHKYCHRKKHENLNKKVSVHISQILIGSTLTAIVSSLSICYSCFGIPEANSSGLITSIAVFIRNEKNSKLKSRYSKLGYWIIVTSLLYEKTKRQSLRDEKIDEKKAQEITKLHNHDLDKRGEIMKTTNSKVEDFLD